MQINYSEKLAFAGFLYFMNKCDFSHKQLKIDGENATEYSKQTFFLTIF